MAPCTLTEFRSEMPPSLHMIPQAGKEWRKKIFRAAHDVDEKSSTDNGLNNNPK